MASFRPPGLQGGPDRKPPTGGPSHRPGGFKPPGMIGPPQVAPPRTGGPDHRNSKSGTGIVHSGGKNLTPTTHPGAGFTPPGMIGPPQVAPPTGGPSPRPGQKKRLGILGPQDLGNTTPFKPIGAQEGQPGEQPGGGSPGYVGPPEIAPPGTGGIDPGPSQPTWDQAAAAAGLPPEVIANPMLQGRDPALIKRMLDAQNLQMQQFQRELAGGATHALDQTGLNPAGFSNLMRQYTRDGMSEEEAANVLNERIRNEGSVVDYWKNQYAGGGSEGYLNREIAGGFLGGAKGADWWGQQESTRPAPEGAPETGGGSPRPGEQFYLGPPETGGLSPRPGGMSTMPLQISPTPRPGAGADLAPRVPAAQAPQGPGFTRGGGGLLERMGITREQLQRMSPQQRQSLLARAQQGGR